MQDFEPNGQGNEENQNSSVEVRQPSKWKQKLAQIGAVVGLGGLGVATGATLHHTYEVNTTEPGYGQPIEGATPYSASLIHITNEAKEDIGPTFRQGKPEPSAHELTAEELLEKGIDPTSKELTVIDVKGAPVSGWSKKANDGIWGEIVVTDPVTKADKRTGIFVSKNFIPDPEPKGIETPKE